ncbi:YbaK/EbsC family protein [Stagnihabitans tardus]|uniref:YbaK/EbsC family protein n=1 Tax=Stagnihabitans tardus TaxID=2699202 RepID=A0AAE5BT05_9RHOB|nr:YbaK/EbsC family protein [Stagnihabitans tardus]NBZ86076.1 YbaK/EbsC family protein [Stagnihabitans tardus]
MSKSLARVTEALKGVEVTILQTPASTRTAAEAAAAAGCEIDQIVKSILFQGERSLCLFLTAGGNQVDAGRASVLAGQALTRADAAQVRAVTGFAIGGVSPVGHLTQSPLWMDPRLMDFPLVWAAAGTPNHIFLIAPAVLLSLTGAKLAPFTV